MFHYRLFPAQFKPNFTARKNVRQRQTMKQYKKTKQIMHGTLIGLMYFFNIPTDITRAEINTILVHSSFPKFNPLTTDTTTLTLPCNCTRNPKRS